MWYEHYANAQGVWESAIRNAIIQNGAANPINPYQQFYDNRLPKWVSPLYPSMGGEDVR